MARFREFSYFSSDECTNRIFSGSFIVNLFEQYHQEPLRCNDFSFVVSKIRAQLSALRTVFEQTPELSRTVLDLGCGNTGTDWEQKIGPDYQPWLSRALHHIKGTDKYKQYSIERIVGVGIGHLREQFECYYLDAFKSGALDVIPGRLGVIIASAFFNSPRLSYSRWGDFRNDSGNHELTAQLQQEIEPLLDRKLIAGTEGLVLYNEH